MKLVFVLILANQRSVDQRLSARREFLREIFYKNIAIISIQHSNMYFVDTSGDFSYTVGWNLQ